MADKQNPKKTPCSWTPQTPVVPWAPVVPLHINACGRPLEMAHPPHFGHIDPANDVDDIPQDIFQLFPDTPLNLATFWLIDSAPFGFPLMAPVAQATISHMLPMLLHAPHFLVK